MTTAPAAAAERACARLMSPPAEKKAISTPSNAVSDNSVTEIDSPIHSTILPADRADAISLYSAAGNRRRASTWANSRPTAPVAPTIATVFMPDCGSAVSPIRIC